MLDLEEVPAATLRRLLHQHQQDSRARDLRSTSHAVTCDYLMGRGLRRCSCQGPRAATP